ncbi:MAG: radical SAM protein [Candidatus Latescibacteria bacterium]|nr:radical SAM protein [Candidatus Latescibacterota bacterium]
MAHSHLTIEETAVRSILVPQGDPPVSEYTLNPYSGCGMGCAYCYVMKFHHARQHPLSWGSWVQPKTNAPFLLGKVRDKIWGRRIFVGSATDPYQYIERQYRITRRCLRVLLESNPSSVVVHTRSQLILDDLDLLQAFGDRLRVGFSVPTDDDRVRRKLEPHAPRIEVRLKTMRTLRQAGIKVTASLAPLLYCRPERFAQLLSEAADGVYTGSMNYLDQTALRHMERAKAYFRSQPYKRLQAEMDRCLQAVGLLEKTTEEDG